ncbi:MAG: hypothetical protein ACRDID_07005, partial [Ktedonobacterales bacterium]
TPGDTVSLAGTSASYSYRYGDASHAAAAIGSAWSASYDAMGEMTCRAAAGITTCAGSSPTEAQLGMPRQA